MNNELAKAVVFFVITMMLSFAFILHKNDWTVFFNGSYHKIT
jgi:hypothetical protein